MIDNYDSFTYNLVQHLGELGEDIKVFRNNKITLLEIERMNPESIVISPGHAHQGKRVSLLMSLNILPARPRSLVSALGHQSIGAAFGGDIIRAPRLMHGKTSLIYHDGKTIFEGISNPFEATRYHSLIIKKGTLPECLEISAWTDTGEIMGVRHKEFIVEGVQFHPESILTSVGKDLLRNFLKLRYKAHAAG